MPFRLILMVVLALESARAGMLTPFHQAVIDACVGRGTVDRCAIANYEQRVIDGTAFFSGPFGSAAEQAQLDTTITATATYGTLKSASASSINIGTPPGHAYGIAVGTFLDVVTISYAPLNGSKGLLYIDYTLNGSITSSGPYAASVLVNLFFGSSLEQHSGTFYDGSVSGRQTPMRRTWNGGESNSSHASSRRKINMRTILEHFVGTVALFHQVRRRSASDAAYSEPQSSASHL